MNKLKTDEWFNGKRYVPYQKLTDKQLKKAFTTCQKNMLFHHNKMCVIDELIDNIEKEAESRGIELKYPNTKFHQNAKKAKEKINNSIAINTETHE
jgi:hypothetical protein